jgi:hypothetical protein
VAFGRTELACEKGLNQIPGHGWAHGPTAHTDDIHVVILNTLLGRKVIMNEPGADAPDLIGTHGSADTAPADCDAAKYFTGSYGPREWNDYVGIIVGRVRFMSTKIDYVMTRRSKLGDELFFQNESAVIGGYSDSHMHTPDFLRGPLLEPAILPFRFRRLFRKCRRTRDTAMRFRWPRALVPLCR